MRQAYILEDLTALEAVNHIDHAIDFLMYDINMRVLIAAQCNRTYTMTPKEARRIVKDVIFWYRCACFEQQMTE